MQKLNLILMIFAKLYAVVKKNMMIDTMINTMIEDVIENVVGSN
ncbi:hypothetical protein [Neobacillus niacini]|nr:hypothetical protein [Neobacillus niacini]